MTFNDEDVIVELTRHEQLQISGLFGEMPYGGLCHFQQYNHGDGLPAGAIISNLVQLRDVLLNHVHEQNERDAELQRYRSITRTLRDFVGLVMGDD